MKGLIEKRGPEKITIIGNSIQLSDENMIICHKSKWHQVRYKRNGRHKNILSCYHNFKSIINILTSPVAISNKVFLSRNFFMVIWLNWIGDPISPLPKMAQKAQGISEKKRNYSICSKLQNVWSPKETKNFKNRKTFGNKCRWKIILPSIWIKIVFNATAF